MLIFYGAYIVAMNWCGKGAVGTRSRPFRVDT